VAWARLSLELKGHQARELAVEEQEVDGKVLAADLYRVFRAHEAEVATELAADWICRSSSREDHRSRIALTR
jgi:hypothetical protein